VEKVFVYHIADPPSDDDIFIHSLLLLVKAKLKYNCLCELL